METGIESVTENIRIKREINRYLNRFFYNKERTTEELAQVYYYLDDFINFCNKKQEEVGNKLLEHKDFSKVYLEKDNVKVYIEDELHSICIDALSGKDKDDIRKEHNKTIIKGGTK